MAATSRLRSRTLVACTWCGKHFKSEDGWAWACPGCAPSALLEGLVAITEAIADEVAWLTCQLDGCLVRPDEHCPACKARRLERQEHTDTEHDPKRPAGWVRRGLIQHQRSTERAGAA